ncbi:hypothetical protein X375_05840 [Oenococcus oeni S13]|uniref:oligosaccharide flippase family protein n=1 Tax=Oenococcus oeni TaxID=1247 RepID=UPI00050FBD68|nr:polysaccharide biosynthesis C-terminal domain-containing protein [Oenococcus oeni]KGH62268.1 hypothetical protein X375_05840 [Oenococcus oeni S13]
MRVVKNYLYNMSYQILLLVLPLVTGPYVSRALGPSGVGINSYTYTIANWFVLLGSIGVAYYGNRQIAYVRNDQKELSINFWEILLMRTATIIGAFIFFLVYVVTIGSYKQYQLVQSSYIVAAGLDISWFFMGIEDFKKTVLRNTIVKVISLAAILLFVKNQNDLYEYILILALSTIIGNITLWPFLKNILVPVKIKDLHPFRHFKGSLALFFPLAAIQIYANLNKVMLGYLDSTNASGFYDKSDVIVKTVLTLATSLGTVLMPHTAKIFSEGKSGQVKNLLYKSFGFISFISIPLAFGLAAISFKFGPFFYGNGFGPVGTGMFIESFVIIFISWASVTGNQYLVPTNQVSAYTKSVFVGAAVNLVLNIPLIKYMGLNGAIIATVCSELSVTLYQILAMRNQISYKKLFCDFHKYLFAGILMFVPTFFMNIKLKFSFPALILEIITGAVIYIISILILRPKILSDLKSFIKNR